MSVDVKKDQNEMERVYVLDTNVLIHDPSAVLKFEEHQVVIPMPVLEELDKLKQGDSDRARQARQATRILDGLMEGKKTITDGVLSVSLHSDSEDESEPCGTLSFIQSSDVEKLKQIGLSADVMDNKILASALTLKEKFGLEKKVILVSNDTNMRVKSLAVDLDAEGYRSDAVFTDIDAMVSGAWSSEEGEDFWSLFDVCEPIDVSTGNEEIYHTYYQFVGEVVYDWHPGMLILGGDGHDRFRAMVVSTEGNRAQAKVLTNYFNGNNVFGVCAKDEYQNFALNILMDQDIDLVSIAGVAGTGKTHLALAAALELTMEKGLYEKIVVTRETVAMGEEIGFLPGTEEEKMAPWMGAFIDNIEEITGMDDSEKGKAGMALIKKRLQMRSLGLMRGRNFTDTLLIIDEGQNITSKQMKNLVTRAGRNTKIICLGNVAQVDSPYLNPGSTGLANLVERFKDWEHSAHITLDRVERSRLAAKAEEVM